MTPNISILIATKSAELVGECLKKLGYDKYDKNVEILVLDNSQNMRASGDLFKYFPLVKCIPWNNSGNYSFMQNKLVKDARGEFLLFLNDDVLLTRDVVSQMRINLEDAHYCAIGLTLLYPDERIQHMGVIIASNGLPANVTSDFLDHCGIEAGAFKHMMAQNYPATTGACLMVRAKDFEAIGGFDETYSWAYEDVDLCLRLKEHTKGYIKVLGTTATHYESKSGGDRNLDMNAKTFLSRWRTRVEPTKIYK